VNRSDPFRALRFVLRSLRGMRCWYVSCGGLDIPSFSLAFGGMNPRPVPLRNTFHSDDFRRNTGKVNLYVWCTWRLDSAAGPVTSSDDTEASIISGLGHLLSDTVESVDASLPGWDLSLQFSGRHTLRLFCDHVPGDPSYSMNWSLSSARNTLLVKPGSAISLERTETYCLPEKESPNL
jgi:hypothetical protein